MPRLTLVKLVTPMPLASVIRHFNGTACPALTLFRTGALSTGDVKPENAYPTRYPHAELEPTLPASSVALSVTVFEPIDDVSAGADAAPLVGPEVASVNEPTTLAGDWFNRKAGAVVGHTTVGAVASRLIVTDSLLVPPALVAVQVSAVPVVSVLVVVKPHPVEEVIADSLSSTVQVTVTSLVYHPLLPSVPLTFGVISGGVVSEGVAGSTVRDTE
jgi:hypothetical protein